MLRSVFRIRMGFSADPAPAFEVNEDPDPDAGVWWLKNCKKNQFFYQFAIHLLVVLQKGRRSLQPSKENIQHFKTESFFIFFVLWVFLPSRNRIQPTTIHADPWVRIRNTGLDIHIFQHLIVFGMIENKCEHSDEHHWSFWSFLHSAGKCCIQTVIKLV